MQLACRAEKLLLDAGPIRRFLEVGTALLDLKSYLGERALIVPHVRTELVSLGVGAWDQEGVAFGLVEMMRRSGAVVVTAAVLAAAAGAIAAPTPAGGAPGLSVRTTGAGTLLLASYRAARHERSFKLSVLNPLAGELVPGMRLSREVFYTVLQTAAASQTVEEVPFTNTSKGKTTHGFISTFEDQNRLCTWGGPAPPGVSTSTPSCQAWNLRSYNSQVFPFLSLQGARIVGTASRDGIEVTGVDGRLNVTTSSAGSTGTMNYGKVTVWIATASKLPVAITNPTTPQKLAPSVSLYTYSEWGKPLRFPRGTP